MTDTTAGRCGAPTKSGKACRRRTADGGYCSYHADLDPRSSRVPGRYERLAYERAERDLERLPALGYWFDDEAAERVILFVEAFIRHHKGEWAGEKVVLEEWQRFMLRQLFGWRRPDGGRRYRTAWIELPKKNGKTFLAAAVGLYLLIADGEGGAEVYAAATKKDQALLCWKAARAMVKQSPYLREHIKPVRNNLSVARTDSFFEPLSADYDTMDGLNVHGAIIDELHAHKTPYVYETLKTATAARRNSLLFLITTAGSYDPTRIGWILHTKGQQVLDRVIQDETLFVFICAADKDDDWRSPSTWVKANPNYGVSVYPDHLERMANDARNAASELHSFEKFHLNRWVNAVDGWIPPDPWRDCGAERLSLDMYDGDLCFAAYDLSSTLDLTALALAFPYEDGSVDVFMRYYVPEASAKERTEREGVPYLDWIEQGHIIATPGSVIDYGFIEADIMGAARRFALEEIAYDEWNATQTFVRLDDEGLPMVPHGQGYASMSSPCKDFEAMVVGGKIRHGGNPVLTWNVNNLVIDTDPAGNIKPNKRRSKEKIDGAVAVIMAIGRALLWLRAEGSVYEDRGVRYV